MTMLEARHRHPGWSGHNAVIRRASYPQDADPETVAIAEYYQTRYPRARIIKLLSFGTRVSPVEINAMAGIPMPLVVNEVQIVAERLGTPVFSGRSRDGKVQWWLLQDARCCAEIRDVIRRSWGLA